MKRNILVSTHGMFQNEEKLTDEFDGLAEVLEYGLEKGLEEMMGVGSLEGRTILFGREYSVGEAFEEIDGIEEVVNEPIAGKKLVNHDSFDVGEDEIGRAIGQAQTLAEKALMHDPEDYIETDLDQAIAIAKNTPRPDGVLILSDGSTPQGLTRTVRNAIAQGIPVVALDIRETVDWETHFAEQEEREQEAEEQAEPAEAPAASRERPAAEAYAVAGGD